MKMSVKKTLFRVALVMACIWCRANCDTDGEDVNIVEDNAADDIIDGGDGPKNAIKEEVIYVTPQFDPDLCHLYEHFDDETKYSSNWIKSSAKKSGSDDMQYDGQWVHTGSSFKGDSCLMLNSRAKHHAIGTRLAKPFKFAGPRLVVQYEVQFRQGQECGGAYMKLLASPSGDLNKLHDTTPYSIMFGPDKCGNDFKLHFIFIHKNPKNGSLSEKHWKKASSIHKLDEIYKDNKWHLFRLIINSDNTFEVEMDRKNVGKGSLLEDFSPPVNPQREIDDPNDSKPEEWDEREKIPDPDARKPDDWDENEPRKISDASAKKPDDWLDTEPEMIPDPEATRPADWDPEMDGEWEPPLIANPACTTAAGCGEWKAPLVDNPKYKGKWKPNMIDNPNYKGKWSPNKIPNPDFFEDLAPYKMQAIDSVAFELWTITDQIAFDNLLITENLDLANTVSDITYQIKKDMADEETDSVMVKILKYTNKRPWLWAVYILVIALPVVLFIAFCCVSPVKRHVEPTAVAAHKSRAQTDKKTDEVIEEDGDEKSDTERPEKFGLTGDEPEPMNLDEENAVDESGEEEEEEEDASAENQPPDEEEEVRETRSMRLRKTKPRKD